MTKAMKDFHHGALAICVCVLFFAHECLAELNAQRTSFSCAGRPAGYYADVETDCQVYHMCDGLGRQFSYTCPNTTLFQQRMLICDHWYMVNCSKAESNYAANLLIGQRDKPFVNDEENSLRTPRPDLLDRPYAPDYSGESFRNQYKQLASNANQILDDSTKRADKFDLQSAQNSQTRWRIPPPSRTILPPAYEPQSELLSSTDLPRATSTTQRTTSNKPNSHQQQHKRTEALYQRVADAETDDLGTSHSTRYNTSADFNSAELLVNKNTTKFVKFIKPPSKIYEPPFVYPIYNQDVQEVQPIAEVLRTSSAAPFSTSPTTQSRFTTIEPSTTSRPFNHPTTYAGQPFSHTTISTTVRTMTTYRPTVKPIEHRTPTPAQAFRQPTPTSKETPKVKHVAERPFNDLLPPFVDFIPHDIATTQGPAIYYEWKVPANGLVPPKLDPPIGVDGREYPDAKKSLKSEFNDIASHNSVVSVAAATATASAPKRLPISRSIKPNELMRPEKAQRRADVNNPYTTAGSSTKSGSTPSDITQLRKQLLIPEYAFPLETIGRTGYAPASNMAGDLYNSFQLKIPERSSSSTSSTSSNQSRWFGENPKCPECHPSFVLPGTCEPCVRR